MTIIALAQKERPGITRERWIRGTQPAAQSSTLTIRTALPNRIQEQDQGKSDDNSND